MLGSHRDTFRRRYNYSLLDLPLPISSNSFLHYVDLPHYTSLTKTTRGLGCL
jgi:hypothetical protein